MIFKSNSGFISVRTGRDDCCFPCRQTKPRNSTSSPRRATSLLWHRKSAAIASGGVHRKGISGPHFVEAKPSFLLKLRKADLLISVGLDLEIGWLPPLITQSGNPRIQPGGGGYLDASQFAEVLESRKDMVTRAMGDVHPLGNPHYWLDPDNGRRVAKGIAGKLAADAA